MNSHLHPLKFQPILKDKIWGGEKLSRQFNKASKSEQLGESWEVSTVPGDISIVSNGYLKGKMISDTEKDLFHLGSNRNQVVISLIVTHLFYMTFSPDYQ